MSDLGRIMALDHGMARIGVAVSDPLRLIARPVTIITHVSRQADFEAIAAIARDEEVARVVVGIPTSSTGGLSRQAGIVVQWGCRLAEFLDVSVVGWDESYTSVAAEAVDGRRSGARSRQDDVAAAILLQDYLDSGGTDGEPGRPIQSFATGSQADVANQ